MIHLKVDGVTRFHRGFFGTNIQFVENGRIQLRTLGVVELKLSHTAKYLQQVILDTLKIFEIEITNIYSFTTDNGSNMIKLAELLIMSQQSSLSTDSDVDESVIDNNDGDNEEHEDHLQIRGSDHVENEKDTAIPPICP